MYEVVLEEGLFMGLVELFLGGPGFASTSPEARSRAANHSGDAHGWQTEKTVWGSLLEEQGGSSVDVAPQNAPGNTICRRLRSSSSLDQTAPSS